MRLLDYESGVCGFQRCGKVRWVWKSSGEERGVRFED
jgi:hypothetical protein